MKLCEICYMRKASSRCRLCGRSVCEECMTERGVCIACSETLCELCGSRHSLGTCAVCGRRVCEECSIQLDPVVRVCRECFARGARVERKPRRELVLLAERLRAELGARRS